MTDRMQAMVESLLMLARADAGQLRVEQQTIDLVAMIDDCWVLFEPRAKARGLSIEKHLPTQFNIRTDPNKLRIVLNNLLDNAVSYTNDGGAIRLRILPEETTGADEQNCSPGREAGDQSTKRGDSLSDPRPSGPGYERGKTNSGLTLEIVNTGNQITQADLPKLFDRFYRGDQARADTGVHCGLGLSLCQRLMRLMGGTIGVKVSPEGEFITSVKIK